MSRELASGVRAIPVSTRELDEASSLFQSGFWAAFKEQFGWLAHPFALEYGQRAETLLVLSRRMAPVLRLAYVPFGPPEEPDIGKAELLAAIGRAVAARLPPDTFALRFDLPWSREGAGESPPPLPEWRGLRRSPVEVQPTATVVVDLRPEEGAILAAMRPKTRYNIALAARRGVQVIEDEGGRLAQWYALHRETARRDRIVVHSLGYYRTLFELARTYGRGAPSLRLLLAEVQGELAAGIIVALYRDDAFYLYGASSSRHRALMPGYALQWRAMQIARAAGCLRYDLFGIPPSSDPRHPMAGLYQFKTGFGGKILNRYGCYDLVLKAARYRAFAAAERLRHWYHKRLRKMR